MNVLVIDTSIWIDYFSGKAFPEVDLALKEGRVYLSPIVAAELMSGDLSAKQSLQFRDFLEQLPLCETPLEHWIKVGRLRHGLRRRGLSVSTPDAHIAQCALELGAYLLSRDRIFQRIASIVKLRLHSSSA